MNRSYMSHFSETVGFYRLLTDQKHFEQNGPWIRDGRPRKPLPGLFLKFLRNSISIGFWLINRIASCFDPIFVIPDFRNPWGALCVKNRLVAVLNRFFHQMFFWLVTNTNTHTQTLLSFFRITLPFSRGNILIVSVDNNTTTEEIRIKSGHW